MDMQSGIQAAGYGPPGGGGYGGPPGGGGYGPPPGGGGFGPPPGAPPGGGGFGPPPGAPPGGYGAPPGGYGGPPGFGPPGFGPGGPGFPGGPMMPGAGGDVNTTVPLVLSILMIVPCCNILGVVPLIFAIQAGNAKKAGDFETARAKAKVAYIIMGVLFGLQIVGGIIQAALNR